MNRKKPITTALGVIMLALCTNGAAQNRTISRLEKDTVRLSVYKPGKSIQNDTTVAKAAKFITFKDKDGSEKMVVESTKEEREQGIATTIDLETVTIVAQSRQVAERNGKVNIDFIVSVPKTMMDKKWLVDIQPRLTRSGDSSATLLDNILLYGKQFRKEQKDGYIRYQRYLNSIKGDSLNFIHAFTNKRLYDITLQRKQQQLDHQNNRFESREAGMYEYKSRLEKRFNAYNRFPIYSMDRRGVPGVSSEYEKLRYLGLSTQNDKLPVNWMVRSVNAHNMAHRYKPYYLNNAPQYSHQVLTEVDSLYWQDFYTRYGEVRRNEWLKDQKDERFARYIKFPKDNVAELDSVIDTGKDFKYYYSHNVLVDENSSKLFLNVGGTVVDVKGRKYRIPDSDTIAYFVSSMVQFADHAPRFRKKVIERRAIANTFANIIFQKNKSAVQENIGDNKAQLQRIQDIIKKLDESSEFILDSITVTASSSPEGSWTHNGILANKRSLTLADYFSNRQNEDIRLSDFIKSRSIPENWDLLKKLLSQDDNVANKYDILQLISNEKNPDLRETRIRQQFPQEHAYMFENYYPKLRNIHFEFNMHRKGMIKDTIQTTEPDTEYAEALKKMEERKYKEALAVLINYDDRNTAICYMSMGYDDAALGILVNLEEDSDNEYLLAILYTRKGKEDLGVKHFLRSVELDESKAWRGSLDPEINALIEKNNLDDNIWQ